MVRSADVVGSRRRAHEPRMQPHDHDVCPSGCQPGKHRSIAGEREPHFHNVSIAGDRWLRCNVRSTLRNVQRNAPVRGSVRTSLSGGSKQMLRAPRSARLIVPLVLFAALTLPAQPSLTATPRAVRVFAQEQDQGEPLEQAPEIPSGQPAAATPSPAPRPILHFDIEGSAGQQRAVLVAVDDEGNRVMTLPVTVGGTWSPRGDWFAFLTGGADARHGALVRANLLGETQRLFTATGDEVLLPLGWAAWSPDASKIALLSFVPAAGLKDYRFALVIVDAVDGHVLARHSLPVETMAAWPAYMAGVDKFRWSTGRAPSAAVLGQRNRRRRRQRRSGAGVKHPGRGGVGARKRRGLLPRDPRSESTPPR